MEELSAKLPEHAGNGIEAGATGDELRLWQAREALRQAELRLASQAASLQAFEARSTASLGWVAAGITAIGGAALAVLSTGHQSRALVIGVAAVPLAISAFYALKVLWPKSWDVVGFEPDWLMNPRYESELEQTEAMASTYAESIKANGAFLNGAGAAMRRAWWWLLAAPTIALMGARSQRGFGLGGWPRVSVGRGGGGLGRGGGDVLAIVLAPFWRSHRQGLASRVGSDRVREALRGQLQSHRQSTTCRIITRVARYMPRLGTVGGESLRCRAYLGVLIDRYFVATENLTQILS